MIADILIGLCIAIIVGLLSFATLKHYKENQK